MKAASTSRSRASSRLATTNEWTVVTGRPGSIAMRTEADNGLAWDHSEALRRNILIQALAAPPAMLARCGHSARTKPCTSSSPPRSISRMRMGTFGPVCDIQLRSIAPGRALAAALLRIGRVPPLVERVVAVAADDLEVDLLVDILLLHHAFDLALEAAMHELAEAAQVDEIELVRDIGRRPQIAELHLLPVTHL